MKIRSCLAFAVLLCAGFAGRAGEPFRFPEGKHGKGELKYINKVPVLILTGTPEEMGEQMGVLALKPAAKGVAIAKEILKREKLDALVPILVALGNGRLAQYPEAYRKEFEAMVKA